MSSYTVLQNKRVDFDSGVLSAVLTLHTLITLGTVCILVKYTPINMMPHLPPLAKVQGNNEAHLNN